MARQARQDAVYQRRMTTTPLVPACYRSRPTVPSIAGVGTVVVTKEPTVGLRGESACAKAINEDNSVENNTSIDRIAQEAANTTVIMTTGSSMQLPIKRAGGIDMGGSRRLLSRTIQLRLQQLQFHFLLVLHYSS